MYLYCYARSGESRTTGEHLLSHSEGEWIKNSESLLTSLEGAMTRADGAIVLFLPSEAAVRFMVERIYTSNLDLPVIRVAPDGTSADVLRRAGYNTYEILNKICSILGSKPLSRQDDRKSYAPNLKTLVKKYSMAVSDEALLDEISEGINEGLQINIYSDIPLTLAEPVLDSLSYVPYVFRSNQRSEMISSFINSCEDDNYSIFITCTEMPVPEKYGKCLLLVPSIIAVGIELAARVDPSYAAKTVKDSIVNHNIDIRAISTLAVSSMVKDNPAVEEIASALGVNVTSFDSRLLKNVNVPLNGTYSNIKTPSDMCTAAACLASGNGRILIRRAGDRNSAVLTASLTASEIALTE